MSSDKSNKPHAAEIISRPEHTVSRDNISDAALKVLYRLKKGGYEAYLVGGSVRDLLLKKSPKDFDVATDATPDDCLLYTSPSPRDRTRSRMPSSA